MRLGIMQPYFFPYLGYFDVINCVDKWVIFDGAQYRRHGWANRNRILHPTKGWQYIVVPLKKHSRATISKDIEIANEQPWQRRVVGQLQHYRSKAPRFAETMALVENCLDTKEESLSRLNGSILHAVCEHLGIAFDTSVFSEMALDLGPVEGPGDWALRICEAIGAREYVNAPGGAALFDKEAFRRSGITLRIRGLVDFTYSCGEYEFIPHLSIIDVLMWNEPKKIKAYLDQRT